MLAVEKAGAVSKDYKDSTIKIVLKKGQTAQYGNIRGISLLLEVGNLPAKILLSRMTLKCLRRPHAWKTVWLYAKQVNIGYHLYGQVSHGKFEGEKTQTAHVLYWPSKSCRHTWKTYAVKGTTFISRLLWRFAISSQNILSFLGNQGRAVGRHPFSPTSISATSQ